MSWQALSASAMALAMLTAPLSAQRAQERVTGTGIVTDASTGQPINGALIEFPALRRQTTSDPSGRFALASIRPGKHRMVVNQLGFKTLVREVQVEEGELIFVALEPDPVLLKAIEVQTDRLEFRRRAIATSVQAFGRETLVAHAAFNAGDFIRNRLNMVPCGNRGLCIQRRGEYVAPILYIDERRAFGLHELLSMPIHDIYLVESYDGGRMVRVYTTWFMQNLARGKLSLANIVVW